MPVVVSCVAGRLESLAVDPPERTSDIEFVGVHSLLQDKHRAHKNILPHKCTKLQTQIQTHMQTYAYIYTHTHDHTQVHTHTCRERERKRVSE